MVSCRSCGSCKLQNFLSLGVTPLADALVQPSAAPDGEERIPLDVALCLDCSLVQITTDVPPKRLFVDNYLYFSSFSDHLLQHARNHALSLIEQRRLNEDSLVVEIASNDGYLLRNFKEHGIGVLGIDPAPAQAAAAEAAGIPTLREFFGPELARRLRQDRPADAIVANNVMAHTPDPNAFVEGVSILLAEDGVATIENAYVRDLIERCEFDTIYHEHFSYFSCTAVDALMRRNGLVLREVEHLPIHGGSLRWYVAKTGQREKSVEDLLRAEAELGMTDPAFYEEFAGRVEKIKRDLLTLLRRLKGERARIAAYGAAAKGSTLLNYTGIDSELVEFVVDRNVHKQGLLMPGVRIPIRDTDALVEEMPDYVLLLAWNFREEIIRQQAQYRANGGRFIVPVPNPEIV